MKISTKGRYGLKAMIDIAAWSDDKCVSLKSVAERIGISESYLEQLVMKLKKAGLVESIRGAQGGYVLAKEASQITVGDILTVMEGSLFPVECLDGSSECSCGSGLCDTCVTRPVWEKIYDSLWGVVDSITVKDLAEQYKLGKSYI